MAEYVPQVGDRVMAGGAASGAWGTVEEVVLLYRVRFGREHAALYDASDLIPAEWLFDAAETALQNLNHHECDAYSEVVTAISILTHAVDKCAAKGTDHE